MEISHKLNDTRKVEEHQGTMEKIVRKSRKDKYIASQKIEIGETSVERPELTAPITTEDGSIDIPTSISTLLYTYAM
ncbi:hypothetical protein CFP56_026247 [Quercus suber]|uniref:Uncharacterized protein n=1 Tax=Quercus suber TaxID=58331 RepID=A0AAW0K0R9_QUESU